MRHSFRFLSFRRARAAVLVGVLAACGDGPTAPGPDLDITLVSVATRTEITQTDDGPLIRCEFDVDATSTGKSSATILGSVLRLYAGPDRTTAYDTAYFPPEVMVDAFGLYVMQGNVTVPIGLNAFFPVPFELEFEARYSVNNTGVTKSAKVRMPCGPTPPPGTLQPPTLDPITVTGTDTLGPADTITVHLRASSSYGVWATRVIVAGAFADTVEYAEAGAPVADRQVSFVIPDDVTPEVPIVAYVSVMDAAGLVSNAVSSTLIRVRDLSPPTLAGGEFHYNKRSSAPGFLGQIAEGQALGFHLDAHDDLAIAWVVAEATGGTYSRDSVAWSGGSSMDGSFIVRSNWTDAQVITLHVVDRVGKRSSTSLVTTRDSLSIYPIVSRARTAIGFPEIPSEPAYDPVRQRFYLADGAGERILVIDALTMTALPAIPIAGWATGLEVSADGDSILAALPGPREVVVIDLAGVAPVVTRRPVRASPIGGGALQDAEPIDIKLDAAGRWIILARGVPLIPEVVITWDPATGNGVWLSRPGGNAEPFAEPNGGRIVRSADRTRMLIQTLTCPRIYDAATTTLGPCRTIAYNWSWYETGILRADGGAISVANGLYDRDLLPTGNLWVDPAFRTRIGYSPDGNFLWAAEDGALDRVNSADGRRLDRTLIGAAAVGIWFSPDGQWIYLLTEWRNGLVRFSIQ